jgi:hypothetical protein
MMCSLSATKRPEGCGHGRGSSAGNSGNQVAGGFVDIRLFYSQPPEIPLMLLSRASVARAVVSWMPMV